MVMMMFTEEFLEAMSKLMEQHHTPLQAKRFHLTFVHDSTYHRQMVEGLQ